MGNNLYIEKKSVSTTILICPSVFEVAAMQLIFIKVYNINKGQFYRNCDLPVLDTEYC